MYFNYQNEESLSVTKYLTARMDILYFDLCRASFNFSRKFTKYVPGLAIEPAVNHIIIFIIVNNTYNTFVFIYNNNWSIIMIIPSPGEGNVVEILF